MTTLTGALRTRDFRLLWIGQGVSVVGDRIFPVALAVAVLDSGGGPSALGLILAARALALIVVVLPAGVIADRVRRTRVMIVADLLRLFAVIGLVAAPVPLSIPVIAALTFLLGIGEGLFSPAAAAVMPQVLPPTHIQAGNALMSLSARTGLLIGPVFGGVLIGLGGVRTAYLVDAATFGVSLISLLAIRDRRPAGAASRWSTEDFVAGLREVRRRRWVGAVIVMSSVHMMVAAAPWTVLLPVLARTHLGGLATYSALLVTFGVGALGGALLAGRWRPRYPGSVALLALFPFATMLTVLAVSTSLLIIGASTLAAGAGLEFFGIIWITALQRDLPGHTLARVTSIDYFMSGILFPAGLAAVGPAADHFGAPVVLLFGASALVVTALIPMLLSGGRQFATSTTKQASVVTAGGHRS